MAGLFLDPWQAWVLEQALGERADGRWAAFEVALVLSRQNGKGSVLEARELAGLFLFGERLIIHSAHLFKTSLDAMRRLLFLIQNTPDLDRLVKRVSQSHGEEGIELKSGQRIMFATRTKGGGRGLSGDCVILDEAMILPDEAMSALMPTMSARPNPQVWYTGSAVDQDTHEHGLTLARVRRRALAGGDSSLAYMEWSAGEWDDYERRRVDIGDPAVWAQANPGIGYRLSVEHTGREFRSMSERGFVVERLGIGDWPAEESSEQVIPAEAWQALSTADGSRLAPVAFAVDMPPNRRSTVIAVAGRRPDGAAQVEVVQSGDGSGWVVDRVVGLVARHDPCAVVVDKSSPAASLIPALLEAGVEPVTTSAGEMAQAFGGFYDAVADRKLAHAADPLLDDALKSARTRDLAGGRAWSRKDGVDISPLVAVTLAHHGLLVHGHVAPPPPPPLAVRKGRVSETADLLGVGF